MKPTPAPPDARKLRWLATVIRLFAYALGVPLLAFGSETIYRYVRVEPGHHHIEGTVVIARWAESSFHGEGACRPYTRGYVYSPVTGKITMALRMVSAGESIEGELGEIEQALSDYECGRVSIPQAAGLASDLL